MNIHSIQCNLLERKPFRSTTSRDYIGTGAVMNAAACHFGATGGIARCEARPLLVSALAAWVCFTLVGCSSPGMDPVNNAITNHDTQGMTDLLARNASPDEDDRALTSAIRSGNYEMIEHILGVLQRGGRLGPLLKREVGVLEYDEPFTRARNDGFVYVAVKDVAGPDALHDAIMSHDARLARLLIKYGAPHGHTYYEDTSGFGALLWPSSMMASAIRQYDETTMTVGGRAHVFVKGRLKEKGERWKGVQCRSLTHAETASFAGLTDLASELSAATPAPRPRPAKESAVLRPSVVTEAPAAMHTGQTYEVMFKETNGHGVILTHYNLTLTRPAGEPMTYSEPKPLAGNEQIRVPANGRVVVVKTVPGGWPVGIKARYQYYAEYGQPGQVETEFAFEVIKK